VFSNLATEARKFAPLALDVLVDLMKSDPSGSVRLNAAAGEAPKARRELEPDVAAKSPAFAGA
jgi:hypothetical protein